ncbi:MAG: hypothetical protein Q8N23_08985 [Archangium sp.]|nr:hypothetical protein [Archangium sp.]MDP3152792.1 hypothetical protein [Archangium sp.]MDP3573579.1 hypothetical protein [Archangium sp.]
MQPSNDLSEFQTSAAYISAIVRVLKKLGQFEPVVAKADAGTAQMLRTPNAQSWWRAPEAFAMTRAMGAVGGDALVHRVGQLAVTESISMIIRPFVSVLLAISGPSPATLLSRFGQITQAAIKNVKFDWKTTGPTSGELTITYPLEVPVEYPAYWLGAFEYVWVTTKKAGTTKAKHNGTSLHFAFDWN